MLRTIEHVNVSDWEGTNKGGIKNIGQSDILDFGFEEKQMPELPFSKFAYPLDINLTTVVNERLDHHASNVTPINMFTHKYLAKPRPCKNTFLLLVVKSKFDHIQQRKVIRETWGNENTDLRFIIRTVFVVAKDPQQEVQKALLAEADTTGDILFLGVLDTYFNNTLKTMGALKWVSDSCSSSHFVMFVDDDYYVATYNILQMINRLPKYKVPDLLMGHLFQNFSPHRHRESKWFVSVSEYPFDMYPSFLSAGTMLMSTNTIKRLQIASEYTKPYRLDDIYIAIVAYKLNVAPQGHTYFYSYKIMPGHPNFRTLLTAHGYSRQDIKHAWAKHKQDFSVNVDVMSKMLTVTLRNDTVATRFNLSAF